MIDTNSNSDGSAVVNTKGRMTISDYFKILLHTSGSDFEFDDV